MQPSLSFFSTAMGKKAELSEPIRAQIRLLHEEGYSQCQIAKRLHVSRCGVQNSLNRPNLKTRPRQGRPRVTTPRTDHAIRRVVTSDPFISSAQIKSELAPHLNNVSTRTIRHRLSTDLRMCTRKPVKKPMLTAAHRQKRLAFCRQFHHWQVSDWKRVMFSDESSFRQFNDVKLFVRRPINSNPLDRRYTTKCVKHSPSVMAWGCFSYSGTGSIMFLDKGVTMNAQRYIEVLQHQLLPSMANHGCTVFQQDLAPCHTARIVKTWFQHKNLNVLPWPANSPDINPIENLWQIVKVKLSTI
jgi:transposase